MPTSLRMLALTIATAISFCAAPLAATANQSATIHLTNSTKYESWVDFSVSFNTMGDTGKIKKALCVGPGQTTVWGTGFHKSLENPRVRIRAEIKLHGCKFGTHTTVERFTPVLTRGDQSFEAAIRENSPGAFSLNLKY